jgi:hypothetical protein
MVAAHAFHWLEEYRLKALREGVTPPLRPVRGSPPSLLAGMGLGTCSIIFARCWNSTPLWAQHVLERIMEMAPPVHEKYLTRYLQNSVQATEQLSAAEVTDDN